MGGKKGGERCALFLALFSVLFGCPDQNSTVTLDYHHKLQIQERKMHRNNESIKIRVREKEALGVERWHEMIKATRERKELKEGWALLDEETNCITFSFIVFQSYMIPSGLKGLSEPFRHTVSGTAALWSPRLPRNTRTVEKAAGAATRTWSNSNELLWYTSQPCFSKLVWRLFMSTLFHILISKTERSRDQDNMPGWGSGAATPTSTFHTHMISKAMQLNN